MLITRDPAVLRLLSIHPQWHRSKFTPAGMDCAYAGLNCMHTSLWPSFRLPCRLAARELVHKSSSGQADGLAPLTRAAWNSHATLLCPIRI